MPKQLFPVNKFEGGVNSKTDPRDIGENQFVDVHNFLVNDVGKLTASESYTAESNFTSPASAASTETVGTGAFAFKSDYAVRKVVFYNRALTDGEVTTNWNLYIKEVIECLT